MTEKKVLFRGLSDRRNIRLRLTHARRSFRLVDGISLLKSENALCPVKTNDCISVVATIFRTFGAGQHEESNAKSSHSDNFLMGISCEGFLHLISIIPRPVGQFMVPSGT